MNAPALLAVGVVLALLALATPASAAPKVTVVAAGCTGLMLNGQLTGFCPSDPRCPGPFRNGTGYYVNGALVACSLD